jgi:hypothetical protein
MGPTFIGRLKIQGINSGTISSFVNNKNILYEHRSDAVA